MDLGIAGKVAIVTASSSGLGDAIARGLAAEGVNLALFARSGDKLRANADDIRSRYGVRVCAVQGDMRNREDIDRLVRDSQAELGGPDILVLNTGRPPAPMRDVLDETDDQRWEDAYRTQLWGAVQVARAVVPLIIARGWGRVVGVSSASVKQPMYHHGLSTVFRAGVHGFLKHLANEIAHTGVTVNVVCPASVATEALANSYDIVARAKSIPLKRIGKPEELASAVAYFASQQAGFITGTTLQVDGGMVGALN